MILQAFRDLEQRWREENQVDKARSLNRTARVRRRLRRGERYATELAAVREALEARLEDLTQWDMSFNDLDDAGNHITVNRKVFLVDHVELCFATMKEDA